jgi:membrane-anchored mycosin MYCP
VADNPWTGAGVVQARDALTRQIRPGRQGKVETTVAETRADAQAPPAPERIDLFSTPRAILLWSGLVAGALLALAFMLRPLLRR